MNAYRATGVCRVVHLADARGVNVTRWAQIQVLFKVERTFVIEQRVNVIAKSIVSDSSVSRVEQAIFI
jgi:hypothetical protein